jgi:hypothetical protein
MTHEKIVSKDKQSVESIDVEQGFSRTKNIRRASIISIEMFDDESENARTFYHIRNMNQLKY